jgi:serine/threonine-protein kinase
MKRIGKYEVCGLLGKGGMGRVYKVRMPQIGKIVALKVLAPHPNLTALLGEEEVRKRFLTEALTMARLRHSNIVAIWDFHDDGELSFFVMEYFCNNLGAIIGESYRVEAPSRVLSVDKTIHYTRQILEGLCCLHHAGIIHRDIKPYNILVTDHDQVKITDFGLSKLHGEVFGGPRNVMVGSPYYAAPEQEEDPDQVDVRADLYSVGIMVYRMLTGLLPADSFKKLTAYNPDLDPAWDAFLLKAVAAEREERFASAKEMLDAFDQLQAAWEEKKERICLMPDPVSGVKRRPADSSFTIRSTSVKVRPKEARGIFGADSRWRPIRYVANDFQVNADGTVIDRTTGLAWEQGGVDYPVTWQGAHAYVRDLNRRGFAGLAAWRLPTVNELMSLLTDVPRVGDLCMEPVFDTNKRWLWSADRRSFTAAWYVSADMGYVSWQDFTCHYYVRAVCSLTS